MILQVVLNGTLDIMYESDVKPQLKTNSFLPSISLIPIGINKINNGRTIFRTALIWANASRSVSRAIFSAENSMVDDIIFKAQRGLNSVNNIIV